MPGVQAIRQIGTSNHGAPHHSAGMVFGIQQRISVGKYEFD